MPNDLVVIGPRGAMPFGDDVAVSRSWRVLQLQEPVDAARPWRQLAPALLERAAIWESCELVLVLTDDVSIGASEVTELFHVMRANHLTLAQPSLSWQGHAVDITTRHNPAFTFRRTSCVDSAALAMSSAQMRDMLPLMAALPEPMLIARLLPACQSDPVAGAAVVDSVQAMRQAPPTGHEPPASWPDALQRGGSHLEGAYAWSGQTAAGLALSLFEDSCTTFIGQLAMGFATQGPDPDALGRLLMAHSARSNGPRPQPVQTADHSQQAGLQLPFGRLKPSPIPS